MQSGQLCSVCVFSLKTKEETNMSYRLSSSEREFAEEHHNLVYAFLKKKGLEINEYYDVVIFAYLTAVRRYFINKNLMQYNFSTIAWRAMESAVYKEKRKKSPILISLDEPLFRDSEITFIDSLEARMNSTVTISPYGSQRATSTKPSFGKIVFLSALCALFPSIYQPRNS